MPEGEGWYIVNPKETWGTPETVEFIAHTVRRVNEMFPDTPVLPIGDISDEDGGHLVPHVSHQSGRDVDLGYYYTNGAKWYSIANADNLDFPRTWAFVKTTITETDVQAMFMDRKIQRLLREYATSIGEDPAWLESIFGGPESTVRPLIIHEDGHASHIHVRYYNPIAQETGRRLYPALIKHKMMSPPTYYIRYKVKRGDTLGRMARKFKTTVKALKKANRLRNSRIYANRVYKIPRKGGVVQPKGPLVIPARRMAPPLVAPPIDSERTSARTEEP
jgi:penicillin-insensitive murein endopeptidase